MILAEIMTGEADLADLLFLIGGVCASLAVVLAVMAQNFHAVLLGVAVAATAFGLLAL